MATKATAPEMARQRYPEVARFQIPGLRFITSNGEHDEFEMEVLPLVCDWQAIEARLVDGGLPKDQAMVYTERFVRMVESGELARAIAERMIRVG